MTTAVSENKALVQRFIDVLVKGQDYDLAGELLTADYTRHDPDTPADEAGPAPFIESLKELRDGLPDGEIHIGELVAENDLVAFEGTTTGTPDDSFMGVEPTGTSIEIRGTARHRVRDGRIAETRANWDCLGIPQAVGAVDVPR